MNGTILEKIIDAKRVRIANAKALLGLDNMTAAARTARRTAQQYRLSAALSSQTKLNIIAEYKRASPSKGIINDKLNPAGAAKIYADNGAAAISVLTEEDFFQGSLDDLIAVRQAVEIPILRKDFVIDAYQIFEAAVAGADAVLLIVAALDAVQLRYLYALADDLGLDVLVEVHDNIELEIALSIDPKIIGVNNRNLKTFQVSLETSRRLVGEIPSNIFAVSESGLVSHDDLESLGRIGFAGFLIGETLMRSSDISQELRKLSGVKNG